MTINTPVAANGTNALGLSGPGSLTLAATNNYYSERRALTVVRLSFQARTLAEGRSQSVVVQL